MLEPDNLAASAGPETLGAWGHPADSEESGEGAQAGETAQGTPASGPEAAVSLLPVRHGGWRWMLAGDRIAEVVGTERLQLNPRAAAGSPYGWLLGEGEEVPVFLPSAPPLARGGGAVVVLRLAAGRRCGLGVELVEELREEPISRLRLLPAPAASRRWAFPRAAVWDGGVALEIAPEAVPHLAAADGEGPAAEPPAGLDRPVAGAPPAGLAPLVTPAGAGLCEFDLPGCDAVSFALPAVQVVEVLASCWPRPVPGASEPFLGLCAWRGEPLAVLDLARAVGLPAAAPGLSASVLVARAVHGRQLLAFPVAAGTVLRQGPFPQSAAALPPFPGARRLLGAFGGRTPGERMLLVPDLDAVFRNAPHEPPAIGAAGGGR